MAAGFSAATACGATALPGEAAASSGARLSPPTSNQLPESGSPLLKQIADLRELQKAMKRERQQVQKDLKHTQRKKQRLCQRARQLSDNDFLQVMAMRRDSAASSSNTAAQGAAPEPAPDAAEQPRAQRGEPDAAEAQREADPDD